jgi:hypothetical protein
MAFVQSISGRQFATGGVETLTFGSATTAGNLICAVASWTQGTNATVAVTMTGESFTAIQQSTDGTVGALSTFYAKNLTGGQTIITFTWTGTPGNVSIAAHELSGRDPSLPLGQSIAANKQVTDPAAGGADGVTSSSVTTTTANEDVIGATFDEEGSTSGIAAGTGFSHPENPGGFAVEYASKAVAGSVAATFTQTGGNFDTYLTGIATFKAVAAAGATLSGTALASITEADIVTGGKTIVITLVGDTFIPS